MQVIWQLETGKRNYLPRLGGALTSIEPCLADPALYVICQADNTIRVVRPAVTYAFRVDDGARFAGTLDFRCCWTGFNTHASANSQHFQ